MVPMSTRHVTGRSVTPGLLTKIAWPASPPDDDRPILLHTEEPEVTRSLVGEYRKVLKKYNLEHVWRVYEGPISKGAKTHGVYIARLATAPRKPDRDAAPAAEQLDQVQPDRRLREYLGVA